MGAMNRRGGWLAVVAFVAGCSSGGQAPVQGGADLGLAAGDAQAAPDLAALPDGAGGDLAAAVDMTAGAPDDLALPGGPDLPGGPNDMVGLDLAMPPPGDLAVAPPDLAVKPPADLAAPPASDLAIPPMDLSVPPADLAAPPADAPPSDMTNRPPPDLAGAPATFLVVRSGDGMAALSSASTAAFVEQRRLDGTPVMGGGFPLALPVAANGNNQPLTLTGNAVSEGQLSRSWNGKFVTLAGYAVAPGVANIPATKAMAANRVVGRIDAAGAVDTSTRLPAAYDGGNVRSATSIDGTAFWVAGLSSNSTGGVHYATLGANGSTQILDNPVNSRVVHLFGAQQPQLFGSSGAGAFVNVFTVGAGAPTVAGQMATSLPGLPVMNASPYSFALFDLDQKVAGLDTLYIGDDRAVGPGAGGVQKWSFDGVTWKLAATFTDGIITGVRGLAAAASGANVTLIAVTTEAASNSVVLFLDDGGPNHAAWTIATAPPNTAYRGVAFAPN